MERRFNLVKNDGSTQEKRIFPRFPYCYLTFRGIDCKFNRVYEVKDISYTGMQLELKDGVNEYKVGDSLAGDLHWLGRNIRIQGKVRWSQALKLGMSFEEKKDLLAEVKEFFSIPHVVKGLKPLHRKEFGLELPTNLTHWLRADGPFEIFVWQHLNGEFSKFQIIFLNKFVEWEDGKGGRTGTCLSKRNIQTSLIEEGEYLFEFGAVIERAVVDQVQAFLAPIPEKLLPQEILSFLQSKLEKLL